MLTFILNPDHRLPLYQQLYAFVRQEIENRNLSPGQKLTSKRQLAAHLKVSLNTVATAYEQLVAEGYIVARPKSGYYVAELDDVLPEKVIPPTEHSSALKTEPLEAYRFDFKTNTVDATFFPFPTWAKISREILNHGNRNLLRAVDPRGYYPLRLAIADYVHQYRGVNCTPDQIIIGAGSEYLLGLAVQLLGRQSHYAVENPSYDKVYKVIRSNGAHVHLMNLDQDGVSLEALTASGADILHLTPSHHFPLGIVMPVKRRMALLKWAKASPDRYILEDDYDSEFRFSGRPIPALQGLDTHDKVIYFNTFTRSLAPSMRISYMILPEKLLHKYCADFSFYSSTVPRFEQHTLHQFIAEGHFERHLTRMRKIYKIRRNKMLACIRQMSMADAITISGENAGLHLLLTVYGCTESELIARAKNEGIRIYGLSEYCIDRADNLPDNVVILGYASFNEDEIETAIGLLEKAWSSIKPFRKGDYDG
ncbi:MAG: PLP-dependent aminotransferase family protein [Eubacterium sp.]